jgi:hypothetical protein
MSLEDALNEHTKAIRELIAAFGGKAGGISIKEIVEPLPVKEKAETKKSVQNAKAVESTTTPKPDNSSVDADVAKSATEHQPDVAASTSQELSTLPAGGTDPISFGTARDLVLKLASANKRDEVKAVNTKHGIAKLGSLLSDENDYNTVTDQAKLEAVYADLLAIEV